MSHFTVYVFSENEGEDLEELLAPYDESLDVPKYVEYTREQAIARIRKEIEDYKDSWFYKEYTNDPEKYKAEHGENPKHIEYLEVIYPQKLKWTDEQCYEEIRSWYEDNMVDNEGNLYSTYNPKSKWDWYDIGGRWDGALVSKDGQMVNEGYADEIDWEKTDAPFAFITPDGEWHEKGKMGWWAIVSDEKEQDAWKEEFRKAVEEYGDCCVISVDCHI